MREETWYKMLVISAVLHLVVVVAFSISIKGHQKRFDALRSYYSVNLVGDLGGGIGEGRKELPVTQAAKAPQKPEPQKKEKPEPIKKSKPAIIPKEQDARSLAPKKSKAPETSTKEELERLSKRIREVKKQAGPVEMASVGREPGTGQGDGLTASSGSGGRLLDPAMVKYLLAIREKIESAWHVPFTASSKKGLEAKVTIKIRKDGRLVDIEIEKNSGNRVFDESALRTLRSVDPFPPLPSSVRDDPLEVELTLRPEGVQ